MSYRGESSGGDRNLSRGRGRGRGRRTPRVTQPTQDEVHDDDEIQGLDSQEIVPETQENDDSEVIWLTPGGLW